VETHDQHILGKLGAATRTQIAIWATRERPPRSAPITHDPGKVVNVDL
jgi:hypothetical protein